MRWAKLRLSDFRDPKLAGLEIVRALCFAPRGLTADEAGFTVEARLRAMTAVELSLLFTNRATRASARYSPAIPDSHAPPISRKLAPKGTSEHQSTVDKAQQFWHRHVRSCAAPDSSRWARRPKSPRSPVEKARLRKPTRGLCDSCCVGARDQHPKISKKPLRSRVLKSRHRIVYLYCRHDRATLH